MVSLGQPGDGFHHERMLGRAAAVRLLERRAGALSRLPRRSRLSHRRHHGIAELRMAPRLPEFRRKPRRSHARGFRRQETRRILFHHHAP